MGEGKAREAKTFNNNYNSRSKKDSEVSPTEAILANKLTVHIHRAEFENIFPEVLEYMYKGTIQITIHNCAALLSFARVFCAVSLGKILKSFIRKNVQRETALTFLEESIKYSITDMQNICIHCIARNFCYLYNVDYTWLSYHVFKKIISHPRLSVKSEFLLYKIVAGFIAAHKELSESEIQVLLSCIRFTWCSYDELLIIITEKVVPASLLLEPLMLRLLPYERLGFERGEKGSEMRVERGQERKAQR
eukprot:TRINITY_DN5089_c2_g1_i2.p1 TRINITY_DN5089_c2_g1~~TRINITY_DN5089_c2_g1_i2.p1  ORF type:complete len:249 (-),score=51.78 TRINITY_DN5089_c2_g1_i2:24-770(-)